MIIQEIFIFALIVLLMVLLKLEYHSLIVKSYFNNFIYQLQQYSFNQNNENNHIANNYDLNN